MNDNDQVEYKSVSDYMGGWHAGKFDFDSRICGVTALNYEKSVVFGDASNPPAIHSQLAPLHDSNVQEDGSLPAWSHRPVSCSALSQGNVVITTDDTPKSAAQVSNQELC